MSSNFCNVVKSIVFYIVHTEWMEAWTSATKNPIKNPLGGVHHPGPIRNHKIIHRSQNGSVTLKEGIKLKTHFRLVNKQVWEFFFSLYSSDYVIYNYVPEGLSTNAYLKGKWINSFRVDKSVVIVPSFTSVSRSSQEEFFGVNPLNLQQQASAKSDKVDNVNNADKVDKADKVEIGNAERLVDGTLLFYSLSLEHSSGRATDTGNYKY